MYHRYGGSSPPSDTEYAWNCINIQDELTRWMLLPAGFALRVTILLAPAPTVLHEYSWEFISCAVPYAGTELTDR